MQKSEKEELGWNPQVGIDDLAKIMVDSDMRAIGLKPIGEGDKILDKNFLKDGGKAISTKSNIRGYISCDL